MLGANRGWFHVKEFVHRFIVALGALSIFFVAFGSGVAAADTFAGVTYARAVEVIGQLKANVVVAGVVGDRLPRDECIVTRSQRDQKNNVMLFLNCNATVASATQSGNSAASPAGREAKDNQAKADYINADPANCAISDAMVKACKDFCDAHGPLCSAGQ
ncbi:hypothetical protein ASD37_21065 [Mycobacterium sp. Root135]|nr:hypothetical protein ASD37_21065 [Mycobacterium sp. Root135]